MRQKPEEEAEVCQVVDVEIMRKNELFWLVFKCYPELHVDMENIWIYGTNIYMLYEDIIREYGDDWENEWTDIDLPFVISKEKFGKSLLQK